MHRQERLQNLYSEDIVYLQGILKHCTQYVNVRTELQDVTRSVYQ